MDDERVYCAFADCPNQLVPGEALLGRNGKMYCSYACAARDSFSGPVLFGPSTAPAEN